jgi:hypothetical protein
MAAREAKAKDDEAESSKPVRAADVVAWAARFSNARALTVSEDGMTPALAVSVATAAGGMRRLETLSLRECKIGTEGAKALAAALTAVSAAGGLRLVKLDLYGNRIGDEGAAALAKALPACAQLATLDVGSNSIGAEGEAALRAAAAAVGPRLKLLL